MQVNQITKRRKSVPLTKEQKSLFKAYRSSFYTTQECAEDLGVSRQVLERVLLTGSASPESISLILKKINSKSRKVA